MIKFSGTAPGALITPVIVTGADGIIREKNLAAELSMSKFKRNSRIDKYFADDEVRRISDARFYHFFCDPDRYCAYTVAAEDCCFWLFFNLLQQGADFQVGDRLPGDGESHAELRSLLLRSAESGEKPDRRVVEKRFYQLRDVSLKILNIIFGSGAGLRCYDARTLLCRLSGRITALFERFGYELSIDFTGLSPDTVYPTATIVAANVLLHLVIYILKITDNGSAKLLVYENDGTVYTAITASSPLSERLGNDRITPEKITELLPDTALEVFLLERVISRQGMKLYFAGDARSGELRITLADPMRMDAELLLQAPYAFDDELDRLLDALLR